MRSPQHPIHSGFGPATTAWETIRGADLRGRTAVVTGGYSGLGLETVRVLADAGARIIVPARDPGRAAAALQGIAGAESAPLDLADPASIDAFAARFLAGGAPLDLLVASAGIMATPLLRDARGHELQFAVNHLGHFQLAARLWPALRRAGSARVVSFSSRGHQIAGIDWSDIDFLQRPYDKWAAYGQSKTANALFAVGLDARGMADGIRAFSLHPGTVLGPLARHLSEAEIDAFNVRDASGAVIHAPERDLKTAAQGAATAVWCATSARLAGMGGVYCEDCDIAPIEDSGRFGVRPWAADPEAAERLWRLSETLTDARIG